MQCIITGCALVDEQNKRWAWGDLFTATDVGPEHDPQILIHNAVPADRNIYWHYKPIPDDSRCTVYIIAVEEYFDKRGVVVIKASDVQFNKAARELILGRGSRA